jgi:hypothetical protein
MHTPALLPLIVALSATLGAAAVQAQDLTSDITAATDGSVRNIGTRPGTRLPDIRDGSSNTIRVGEAVPNSLLTRANVSGDITQTSNQTSAAAANQFVSIGGVRALTGSTGSITTQGTLTGNLVQTRSGNPGSLGGGSQNLNIGSVAGAVTARRVDADGAVLTNVTQSSSGSSSSTGVGSQTIDVGSVRAAGGGNITTSGLITGPGVTQTSRNELAQTLAVGSVEGGEVQNARTQGLVSGRVTQSSASFGSGQGRSQRIDVADIRAAQARTIDATGTISGAVSQSQSQSGFGADQSVAVGSVAQTDAAGSITTNGTVTGAVTQSAGSGSQRLLVAAVLGGSPTTVGARATLSGTVNQTSNASGANEQRIAIGAVEGSSGQISTDATVGATLSQSIGGGGASREQLIAIASVEGTQGTVSTRAVVNGSISQSNQSSQSSQPTNQRIQIGSVRNTGTLAVRTDVTVTGNLSQSANASSRGQQSILIGGVSAD